MGSRLTTYVWDHYPEGGGELLTALAAAEHGDPNGDNIYPSIKTLCAMTQQSDRTVQRHLLHMEAIGWLVVVQRGGGRGKYTKYRMPIELIPQDIRGTVTKLRCLSQHVQACPNTENLSPITDEKGDKTPTSDALKGDKTPTTATTPIGVPVPITTKTKNPHTLPADFKITDDVRAWAKINGYEPFLKAHFDFFVDWATASGTKKLDWDATFRNCIRSDWGRVRKAMVSSGFRPAGVIDKSCVENIGQGQKCGMPGNLHGGEYVCDGHYRKRMEKREMPADSRKALANICKPSAVTP